MYLNEATKTELINKSKTSYKGRQRFNRRLKSKVKNVVAAMNKIDMNKLFKEDILTVGIPVQGETDEYTVTISFGGFLELLNDEVERSGNLTYREISRAAINGFNKDDIYIGCSCPDQTYRFNYFASRNNYNSVAPETRPSRITNPNDTLGSGCKHILLVLNNNSWIMKVSRAIMNYITYMQQHYPKMYADIIYPAIYGKEYEEPVQLSMEDDDELQTDMDTLNRANVSAVQRTRFQPGNQSGIQFAPSNRDANQTTMGEENPDDVI